MYYSLKHELLILNSRAGSTIFTYQIEQDSLYKKNVETKLSQVQIIKTIDKLGSKNSPFLEDEDNDLLFQGGTDGVTILDMISK